MHGGCLGWGMKDQTFANKAAPITSWKAIFDSPESIPNFSRRCHCCDRTVHRFLYCIEPRAEICSRQEYTCPCIAIGHSFFSKGTLPQPETTLQTWPGPRRIHLLPVTLYTDQKRGSSISMPTGFVVSQAIASSTKPDRRFFVCSVVYCRVAENAP